jgi:hypothetical protein
MVSCLSKLYEPVIRLSINARSADRLRAKTLDKTPPLSRIFLNPNYVKGQNSEPAPGRKICLIAYLIKKAPKIY